MSFNKTTDNNLKTISLCIKIYLLISSQGQPPSPSAIIMHKHFRDHPLPSDYVICECSLSCFVF